MSLVLLGLALVFAGNQAGLGAVMRVPKQGGPAEEVAVSDHPPGGIDVDVELDRQGSRVHIVTACRLKGATGVEMEALTAVSIAALTLYDMCKALSHDIVISEIRLEQKTGGKNDFRR